MKPGRPTAAFVGRSGFIGIFIHCSHWGYCERTVLRSVAYCWYYFGLLQAKIETIRSLATLAIEKGLPQVNYEFQIQIFLTHKTFNRRLIIFFILSSTKRKLEHF